MDINISSQIVVQTAAQWASDTTVYSEKRILVTSDAYWDSTDQRKFKIADGVQTWSQLQYLPVGYEVMTTNTGEFLFAKTVAGRVLLYTNGQALHLSAQLGGNPSLILNADGTIKLENGTVNRVLETDGSNLLTFAQKGTAYNKNFGVSSGDILLQTGTTANQVLVTDSNNKVTTNAKGTAFNKNFGVSSGDILLLGSTSVASQILATDANNQVQTLATSTYPNLTELSYVKGVTSAIQTQLGTKVTSGGALGTPSSGTLTNCTGLPTSGITGYQGYNVLLTNYTALSPADATTYYTGFGSMTTTAAARRIYIPKSGTIKAVYGFVVCTAGSNEAVSLYVRLNNTTDTTITTTLDLSSNTVAFNATGLSTAVVAGDYIELKMVCPTWATNPTGVNFAVQVYIE